MQKIKIFLIKKLKKINVKKLKILKIQNFSLSIEGLKTLPSDHTHDFNAPSKLN